MTVDHRSYHFKRLGRQSLLALLRQGIFFNSLAVTACEDVSTARGLNRNSDATAFKVRR